MEFGELANIVLDGITPTLQNHAGAALAARERCKLDAWLKVELIRALVQTGLSPDPHKEKLDASFGTWGLLMRSLVTNIAYDNVREKKNPVKKNISDLIKDIWRLTNPGQSAFANRALVLVAYPTTHDNERWQSLYLRQITSELSQLEFRSFNFWGDIPGVLYVGLCT